MSVLRRRLDPPASKAHSDFMAQNFDALTKLGFSAQDIEHLPVGELIERIESWVTAEAAA